MFNSNTKNILFSLHQINTITGDLNGNTTKIVNLIRQDASENVEISVFPETAISGYMCGSLWDRFDFVKDQIRKLEQIKNTYEESMHQGCVVIGFVNLYGSKRNGLPLLTNSVAVIHKVNSSVIIDIYDKQLLASTDHHEDVKYFKPGKETKIFNVNLPNLGDVKFGVPICEDGWVCDHKRDIPREMVEMGADFLISINQSYMYYGKQKKRYELFSKIAKDNDVPVIYLNSIGLGDILKNIVAFDGGSMVFDINGRLVYEADKYKELSHMFKYQDTEYIHFSNHSKYREISDVILFEQKHFFELQNIENALIAFSGGIDSALVLAMVIKAMGKDHTKVVTMPSNLSSDSFKYINWMQDMLNINVFRQPIQEMENLFLDIDKKFMFNAPEIPSKGLSSFHAVLRTVYGLVDCHRFNAGIVATGNQTEDILGWASFHDIGSVGVHSPISDLMKIEIYQLSEYVNNYIYGQEIIPKDLYDGTVKPSAQLPDSMEDPIDYWIQSGICASLVRDRKSLDDLMWEYESKTLPDDYFPLMGEVYKYSKDDWKSQIEWAIGKMRISVYKTAQAPPKLNISPRSRGFSNRETLINYYKK